MERPLRPEEASLEKKGFFFMFPHHQNEEREGGKGGEEGRDWGAQERSDKIEKPRSKEDPFRSTIFECDDFG